MSRILITGVAGCLGSNLLEHLHAEGHELFGIDTFATGKREVVPAAERFTFKEGSVADRAFMQECFHQFAPEIVIHSAASYKDPENHAEDTLVNTLGSIIVAEASRLHGVQRIVNFQTALCYGRPASLPVETDAPLAPFTSYGISKTAGEQYLLLSGLPVVSLRIANVCAPRLAIGPIPTFYKRLKQGQSCFCSDASRDFLAISDFLSCVTRAMDTNAPTGVFHAASGEAHSIQEIYHLVRRHLGLPIEDAPVVPVGADDVPVMCLSPAKTTQELGWKPQKSFSETILEQLTWYDRYGVTDIYSHLASSKE